MPYSEAGLPFSGSEPLSRHCSFLGAQAAHDRALPQAVRYLSYLKDQGERGATDSEAAAALGIARSSINARRAALGDLVVAGGTRRGVSGVRNVAWVAR